MSFVSPIDEYTQPQWQQRWAPLTQVPETPAAIKRAPVPIWSGLVAWQSGAGKGNFRL
jgi:hypothetical protein